MRRLIRCAVGALLVVGCNAPSARGGAGDAAPSHLPPATFEQYDAGAVPGGPGATRHYALGAPAPDSLIARWNSDIGPDGAELPPGKGSVAEGAALYTTACASCHGVGGVGGIAPNPALVGRDSAAEGFRFARDPALTKTIGNYWPYATTLFDYIRRAMPQMTPGTLRDDQVYALTAYLLSANRIIPDGTMLDAAALRAVKMPYRDRFVSDDRAGGAGVR
ncbi:MAG: cytochrome c [Gemmatimonadota bacterium]